MSLMIAQSAFLCSLFDTVCSASRGPPLAVGVGGITTVLAGSFGPVPSALRCSSSFCTVRASASSFLCRGVDAKTRREESRSNGDGEGQARRVLAVWREHGTKPGRKSSRLANMLCCCCRCSRHEQNGLPANGCGRKTPPKDSRIEERASSRDREVVKTTSKEKRSSQDANTKVVHSGTRSSSRRCSIACEHRSSRLITLSNQILRSRLRPAEFPTVLLSFNNGILEPNRGIQSKMSDIEPFTYYHCPCRYNMLESLFERPLNHRYHKHPASSSRRFIS